MACSPALALPRRCSPGHVYHDDDDDDDGDQDDDDDDVSDLPLGATAASTAGENVPPRSRRGSALSSATFDHAEIAKVFNSNFLLKNCKPVEGDSLHLHPTILHLWKNDSTICECYYFH